MYVGSMYVSDCMYACVYGHSCVCGCTKDRPLISCEIVASLLLFVPKRVKGQLRDSTDDHHNGIGVISINVILLLVLGHPLLDQPAQTKRSHGQMVAINTYREFRKTHAFSCPRAMCI